MSRQFPKLVLLAAILAASWFFGAPKVEHSAGTARSTSATHAPVESSGTAQRTWGRMDTLADHFARHGRDFQAFDANDYAAQAAAFLQRAKMAGFPAKRDADGTLRVFDWSSGAFGAYNADGTTRTYFKPGSRDYFDRQPGARVDLRTAR